MQHQVSVIIPIYNVEKYIERCVRSLMEQTLDNIEYIFVNDCTPDKSMDILRKVIADYPNRQEDIYIINHQKNSGSAIVRNTGLHIATGEYLIYCDSDDWIEPDMYGDMYNKAKETDADIVVTDFYNEYASYFKIKQQPYSNDNIQCVSDMLSGKLHCGTWNKLVRRELYLQNNISFPVGVNMWEDVATMIPICYYAKKIVYLPKAYYHYVQTNGNSYTKKVTEKSLQDMIEVIKRLEAFLHSKHLNLLGKLNYMKLSVKLRALINTKGTQQQIYCRLYPESTPYMLSYEQMSYCWRIALKFVSWRLLFLFNLMVRCASVLKGN